MHLETQRVLRASEREPELRLAATIDAELREKRLRQTELRKWLRWHGVPA